MPEQISNENPIPDEHNVESDDLSELPAAEETGESSRHFLAPILGELSLYQAGVMLMRYHPDGRIAMRNAAIAEHYGVSENAIGQTVRRVWHMFPDLQPEATARKEYGGYVRGPREKPPHDRQESYSLGDAEVLLDPVELQIMSLRYNHEGKVIAEQKEIAEQLGISQDKVGKIERRVLKEFSELAEVVQAARTVERAKTAERAKAKRRIAQKRTPPPKPAKETKPAALAEESSLPDFDRYTREVDLGSLYDVSKPLDDEN